MILLDGKSCAQNRLSKLKAEIISERGASHLKPGLAVIRVGDDPASKIYVSKKIETCRKNEIESFEFILPASATQSDVTRLIEDLNNRSEIHGILVQLPLPQHLSEKTILEQISPLKDVDGFHPLNRGKLLSQEKTFIPCTPKGIMTLLEEYEITLAGKSALVIGRSAIVGRPMSLLLDYAGATVTVAHSQTKNIQYYLNEADVVVVAIGRARFLSTQNVKQNVVLIDVGINRLPDGQITGDIDFDAYKNRASAITPVPGGIGPMTICSLLENTWQSFQNFSINSRK